MKKSENSLIFEGGFHPLKLNAGTKKGAWSTPRYAPYILKVPIFFEFSGPGSSLVSIIYIIPADKSNSAVP